MLEGKRKEGREEGTKEVRTESRKDVMISAFVNYSPRVCIMIS